MTPFHDERRTAPRCVVVKNRLSIEFNWPPRGPAPIGATLVNISRGGALVVADKPVLREVAIIAAHRKPGANRLGRCERRSIRSESRDRSAFRTGLP